MMASGNGHVEVVDKLLQHGARADLQTKVNRNAAYFVVAYWLPPCICTMICESALYTSNCLSLHFSSELHVLCY